MCRRTDSKPAVHQCGTPHHPVLYWLCLRARQEARTGLAAAAVQGLSDGVGVGGVLGAHAALAVVYAQQERLPQRLPLLAALRLCACASVAKLSQLPDLTPDTSGSLFMADPRCAPPLRAQQAGIPCKKSC